MDTETLIHGVVQQTMVLIGHLATAGGVRTPLARVADQVFLDLTEELHRQGVSKNVISDMFGMALRTYHRRARTLAASRTDSGRGVWDAVLAHIRDHEPIALRDILDRFRRDDPVVVKGVVQDMTQSGFVYRSGQGDAAVFRCADAADFKTGHERSRAEAIEYLVWMTVYRQGPMRRDEIVTAVGADGAPLDSALDRVLGDGRVTARHEAGQVVYESPHFDIPVGASQGWEAAVLDHFRSLVSAVCIKLRDQATGSGAEATGGTTLTFDVWPGHPLEFEARGLLEETRKRAEELRARIDEHNRQQTRQPELQPVVFYAGQYVRTDDGPSGGPDDK